MNPPPASRRVVTASPRLVLADLDREGLDHAHALIGDPWIRRSWRTRGRYWSRAEFEHRVGSDPALVRCGSSARDGRFVGLCGLHDLDLVDRRAQLGRAVVAEAFQLSSPLTHVIELVGHLDGCDQG